jgi:hypothetical protein
VEVGNGQGSRKRRGDKDALLASNGELNNLDILDEVDVDGNLLSL